MLNFPEFNPNQTIYPISNLITGFRDDRGDKNPPDLIFTPGNSNGDRYPIRVLVIGIPDGVNSVIGELQVKHFADMAVWSPGLKSQHPGEIMRFMTRYFVMK